MCRGLLAVQQAGGSHDERARAHGQDARSLRMGVAQGIQQGLGRALRRIAPAGDQHRSSVANALQPMLRLHMDAADRSQWSGLDRAHVETVPDVELGAVETENLHHDAEFERAQAVVDDAGDIEVRRTCWYGRILSNDGKNATHGPPAHSRTVAVNDQPEPETVVMAVRSAVSLVPPAAPSRALEHFEARLSFETDCWDVHYALRNGLDDFVLLDVRSPEQYRSGHVPGAINLPHAKITADALVDHPSETLFVVYCAGPHCNGANKAAVRLARLGRRVKEMIGGVEGWKDEEFLLTTVSDDDASPK
jgi:rhodanese-related sulfurtransferase